MSKSVCKGRMRHEERAKPPPEALNERAEVLFAQKFDRFNMLAPVLALGVSSSDCP